MTVQGADVDMAGNVTYAPDLYPVTFDESGLLAGTMWSVTVNGLDTESSTGSSIIFEEPGGYPGELATYTVGAVPGYTVSPQQGNVLVNGTGEEVQATFASTSPSKYSVNFVETGLPSGTSWTMYLNGSGQSVVLSTISFDEPNGTYNYAVVPVPGYTSIPSDGSVTVAGADASIEVNFTAIPPPQYRVSFTETGLLPDDSWAVTFNGTTQESTVTEGPDTIDFSAPNGTYVFTVDCGSDSSTPPLDSHLTVAGDDVSFGVSCTPTFLISFEQSSASEAPEDEPWTVILGGTPGTAPTGDDKIDFRAPNGTYLFSVEPLPGYVPTVRTGEVSVAGADPDTVNVTFLAVNYTVTLRETGLPARANWSATLNGTSYTTRAGLTIAAQFPAGTYDYEIQDVPGYHQRTVPYSGTFTLNGSGITVVLGFYPQRYTIGFIENGLPNATVWGVNVTALGLFTNVTFHGNGTVQIALANGTYNYSLVAPSAWSLTQGTNGSIFVRGGPASTTLTFAYTSNVTVRQTGIPNGTRWMVQATITSTAESAGNAGVGLRAASWFANSTGPTALLHLVNGTYSYVIMASGYQTTSGGPFTVNGQPTTLPLVTVSSSPSSTGIAWWVYAIIGVAISAVVVGVVIGLMRHRRPPGADASLPPPTPPTNP